jgi:hypothetical protein
MYQPAYASETSPAGTAALAVELDDGAHRRVAVETAGVAREDDPVHVQLHSEPLGDRVGQLELKARQRAVLARVRQRVGMRADVEGAALTDAGERGGADHRRGAGGGDEQRQREHATERGASGHCQSVALDSDMM